ncbi:MAG TPA: SDR family oxidoreductase [Hyphomicrobiales bacterium]|nr:SDR family oxidoreductase [Hyphomicrobiales bacterium]
MDLGLRAKRALVTAASRGLGLASARALAVEGARVALAARNPARLNAVAEELAALGDTDVFSVELDLTQAASIGTAVKTVLNRWSGIDILVINTGGTDAGPFLSLTREQWQQAIAGTIMPSVDLLHAVLPSMKANGGGRVLFITTVGVKVTQPNMVLSNATRLAMTGIAKTLAVELAADNILVNSLCPGPIDTDRMIDLVRATAEAKNISLDEAKAIWLDEVPLGRMGRAEDFGKLVAMLVSDAASFITGAALAVDGGKSRAY